MNNRPWYIPETRDFIATLLIIATVVVIVVLIFHPIATDNQLLNVMLGGLMTVGFANVITYYFGSSSGSKDKDDTISKMAVSVTGTGSGATLQPLTTPLPTTTGGEVISVAGKTEPAEPKIGLPPS